MPARLSPAQRAVLALAAEGIIRRWAGDDGASRWFEDAYRSSMGMAAMHRTVTTLLRRGLVEAVRDSDTHERAAPTPTGSALLAAHDPEGR